MSRRSSIAYCGALGGLAVLLASTAVADDTLREQVHEDYKHRSYMLVQDADRARLYLFGDGGTSLQLRTDANDVSTWEETALDKLQSPDARTRVRGLTELAGAADPRALDAALTLLADPSPEVREEAAQLVLDHPHGEALADALGLIDEDEAD
ncbi:MAG: hypothetical protein MJA32_13340 [Proteobacteria bacterium]|nr:hypothetical protein [Pseudomonadota bacterium]